MKSYHLFLLFFDLFSSSVTFSKEDYFFSNCFFGLQCFLLHRSLTEPCFSVQKKEYIPSLLLVLPSPDFLLFTFYFCLCFPVNCFLIPVPIFVPHSSFIVHPSPAFCLLTSAFDLPSTSFPKGFLESARFLCFPNVDSSRQSVQPFYQFQEPCPHPHRYQYPSHPSSLPYLL